ncbi:MAG: hypothetical protein ACODAC_07485, partial [Pseudomonadota bacterium]
VGRTVDRRPLPALAHAIAAAADAAPDGRTLATLDQLVREYGPGAALSLDDARLAARAPLADDPAGRLLQCLLSD